VTCSSAVSSSVAVVGTMTVICSVAVGCSVAVVCSVTVSMTASSCSSASVTVASSVPWREWRWRYTEDGIHHSVEGGLSCRTSWSSAGSAHSREPYSCEREVGIVRVFQVLAEVVLLDEDGKEPR